ncbi:MAG: NfeD family protein [Sulfurisoma sp.]|nr:NfeD family protein [Sulfurisoma sp.]
MELEWWHWAVTGIALILAELAVPAFVLVWFGLGGLVMALVVAIAPSLDITAQLAIWLAVSLAFTGVWFKVFKRGSHKTHIGMSDADVVGEIGILTHDVAPFARGEVRFQKPLVGADVWPCIADEEIKAGERVKVLTLEGSLLKVKRS